MELASRGQGTHSFRVPAGTAVLIAVHERGVDARIEITAAPARGADSPLNRWGPQRVVLEAGPARKAEVTAINKARTTGSVIMHVYALPRTDPTDNCVAALHWLASGDAHYDRGQAVSTGRLEAEAGAAAARIRRSGCGLCSRRTAPRQPAADAGAGAGRAVAGDRVRPRTRPVSAGGGTRTRRARDFCDAER